MKYIHYNEAKSRGKIRFPIERYYVDEKHAQYVMPLHWHVELELVRVLKGEFTILLDDTQITAKTGEILCVNSGVLHSGKASKYGIYECLVFEPSMLAKHNQICSDYLEQLSIGEWRLQPHIRKQDGTLYQASHQVFEHMKNQDYGYELGVCGGLLQLFCEAIKMQESEVYPKQKQTQHRQVKKLKKVLLYIEQNYENPFKLEELALLADMSPKYFCRFFREMTQRTPIDYLNHYRIERACSQLIFEDLSVTEIAYSCGFHDLSYFIKTFKKHQGVTPKQYREIHSLSDIVKTIDK